MNPDFEWTPVPIRYVMLDYVISPSGLARYRQTRIMGEYVYTRLKYLFTYGNCHYELILDADDKIVSLYEEINEINTYEICDMRGNGTVITALDCINNITTINYPDMQGGNHFIGQPSEEAKEKAGRLWRLANDKVQEALADPCAKTALRQLPLPVADEIWQYYRTL